MRQAIQASMGRLLPRLPRYKWHYDGANGWRCENGNVWLCMGLELSLELHFPGPQRRVYPGVGCWTDYFQADDPYLRYILFDFLADSGVPPPLSPAPKHPSNAC